MYAFVTEQRVHPLGAADANYEDAGVQWKQVAFIVWCYTKENQQLVREKPKLPDPGFGVGF